MNRDMLQFNVLRNALYSTGRRMFFERCNRWFNFVQIALGAAAVADVVSYFNAPWPPKFIGLAVAIVGAAQLAFDFGGRARDHQKLQREYYDLLADLETVSPSEEDIIAKLSSRQIRIYGDEPPIMRALDAKAYNDAIDANGRIDESERLHIPILHRVFGSLLSFDGYRYETLKEYRARSVLGKIVRYWC